MYSPITWPGRDLLQSINWAQSYGLGRTILGCVLQMAYRVSETNIKYIISLIKKLRRKILQPVNETVIFFYLFLRHFVFSLPLLLSLHFLSWGLYIFSSGHIMIPNATPWLHSTYRPVTSFPGSAFGPSGLSLHSVKRCSQGIQSVLLHLLYS